MVWRGHCLACLRWRLRLHQTTVTAFPDRHPTPSPFPLHPSIQSHRNLHCPGIRANKLGEPKRMQIARINKYTMLNTLAQPKWGESMTLQQYSGHGRKQRVMTFVPRNDEGMGSPTCWLLVFLSKSGKNQPLSGSASPEWLFHLADGPWPHTTKACSKKRHARKEASATW